MRHTPFYGIGVHTRRCYPFGLNVCWLRLHLYACVREWVSRNVTTKIVILLFSRRLIRALAAHSTECACVCRCMCGYICIQHSQHCLLTDMDVCCMCNRCVHFATDIYLFKIGSTIRIDILKFEVKKKKCEIMKNEFSCLFIRSWIEAAAKNLHCVFTIKW